MDQRKQNCIFKCPISGITLHRFPNPNKYPEVFADWLKVVGNILKEKDTQRIYANKRICGNHFLPEHRTTGHRLIKGAKPTLHLNGVLKSMVTITEAEHNYCFRVMPPSLPATSPTLIGERRFQLWLKAVNNPALYNLSKNAIVLRRRVCRKHFETKYIRQRPAQETRFVLTPHAYPTLFSAEEIQSGIQNRLDLENNIDDGDSSSISYHRHDHTYCLHSRLATFTIRETQLAAPIIYSSEQTVLSETIAIPSSSSFESDLRSAVTELQATLLDCCKLEQGPLHSFPKRMSNVERFTSWKEVLSSDMKNCSDQYLYNQVRLCYRHFEHFYRSPNRQITRNAIPTLNLGPLHTFPKLNYDNVERFKSWKGVLRQDTKNLGDNYICNQVRLCYRHFEDFYRCPGSCRVTRNAIPTLNLYVLHRFPKPEGSSLERFIQWKEIVGQRLAGKSALDIYTNFRICNHHFEDRFFYSHSKRLAKTSYPTLNLGQYDVVERTDAPKNQTDKDVPGPSKPLEPNISNKTNVASKTDPSTAKIYGDLKADDNLDSADNEGFDSCLYFTIEDVPLEPPKEFSWQETKATVDLADDGDDIQDDLSLYCSDDEEKPPVYENSEDPGAHIGFHCNVCKKEIVGFRYVCVQCSDFDLCGGCEAQGAHHQHYVLRVPGPRPHREVQSVLARIRKQLMASMDPIQVADDAISIKSEVKDEDEEMLLQEADTIRVREETENGNEKENQETSQDEGETSQEEADPLRTHNNSEAESSVDDSEAEWRPSKEDLADLERTDHDFPSNMRRYTRTRLTNIKPSTEEMPPRSNIEQSDKGQQTFKNKTQVIKIKPLPTNVAQAKLRIIQSNSGANVIPLPVSQVDPKIVLNRINLDKLTKPIMAENASLKKRRIIMSTSDFEKFLTMQQPAKKVFTAGVSGNNIATSHRQPSNIYASSSKTNNDDTIR